MSPVDLHLLKARWYFAAANRRMDRLATKGAPR